ncbi:MAG: hypothetical protein HY390_07670 [Deltaproteobacteria bacterium]|nr:hypothetical protein [Deltaproteobacteria bacterium]
MGVAFKPFNLSVFLLGLGTLLLLSCGKTALESAGITANDTILLKDTGGNAPAAVIFAGSPSSVTPQDSTKTLNVAFHVEVDLNKSQQALNAVLFNQPNEPVNVQVVFIDTDSKSFPFTLNPILKSSLTDATRTRHTLPIAIEDIAKIDFFVDGKLVATFPEILDTK